MSTIAAISTPRAQGGISVIRISGKDALSVAEKIFQPISHSTPATQMEGYTCAYGKITDGAETVDDGVLTVFRAPKSYTGEDVAEISCHGGIFVTDRVLKLAFSNGAEPAEPGEFTKRAFLNGKMSLTQAEAVMDVISADGKAGLKCAEALREGALYRRIKAVSDGMLKLLGSLAAWVDYPEDDIPAVEEYEISAALELASSSLDGLLSAYDSGRIIREGADTAIVGRPNVGKSTLMNLLSGCERSIVTDIAGTTRDIVEESVRLGDIVLRLSDTAGIRETGDLVESVGVDRARKKLETADLILAVFDTGAEIAPGDIALAESCKGRNAVAILNKSDLEQRFDFSAISACFRDSVTISAGHGEGLDKLQAAVEKIYNTAAFSPDRGVLANERQRSCAVKAKACFDEALEALHSGATYDAVNILIDEGENHLLELTGERASEAVVNEVFSRFCVGK
ncbi:MAG: tRNA uridine-5-carboxymethylaminomethyl(34) synthesis GTPase MnmE [Oscillospiraceae bacterium]|nr:tRNA uridine-5-carboxymethylaminomethyl(34) synthesis GTPase MnmE [Oscillospiraceae bacterium]